MLNWLTEFKGRIAALAGMGAVPGMASWLGFFPGGLQTRGLVGAWLELVMIFGLLLLYTQHESIRRWSSRTTTFVIIASFVASAVITATYVMVTDLTVKEHRYYRDRTEVVLLPLAPALWAKPRLDSMVACVRAARESCVGLGGVSSYSTEDVVAVIEAYGPAEVLPQLAAGRRITLIVLGALLTLLVVAIIAGVGSPIARTIPTATADS